MEIVVALVLGVLALLFVLYPLYRHPSEDPQPRVEQAAPMELAGAIDEEEKEQAARTSLQEVEFDYQLGNISDEDYQALRERYMQRALVALRSRYEREQEIDREIEEQLRKLKEQGA